MNGATTSRHQLLLRAPDGLDGCWDAERLGQLLDNLVTNAIKYSDGGEIEVSLHRDGKLATIAVSDHGIGIDPEEQARLFEPFTRLPSGEERVKGSGLGLYIAKAIVDAHGGHLGVASVPGQGSVFRITLPIRPADPGQTSTFS